VTPLRIVLEGRGAFPELQGKKVHRAQIESVTSLAGGMQSGKASVAVLIPLEDGSYVFAETSLSLFCAAARAFIARHGDPADEP